ncbi:hypothetical protein Tco_1300292 [Tanacetum coccineum]
MIKKGAQCVFRRECLSIVKEVIRVIPRSILRYHSPISKHAPLLSSVVVEVYRRITDMDLVKESVRIRVLEFRISREREEESSWYQKPYSRAIVGATLEGLQFQQPIGTFNVLLGTATSLSIITSHYMFEGMDDILMHIVSIILFDAIPYTKLQHCERHLSLLLRSGISAGKKYNATLHQDSTALIENRNRRLNAKSTRKMLWQKGCSELIRNLTSVEKQMLSVERTSQNAVSTPSSRFEFSCNRKAKLLQRRVAPAKETTLNLSLIYDG